MMQGPKFWSKNLTGYPAHRNTIKGGGMPADCTPSRRAQIDHDGRWTFKRGRKRQTLSEEDHKRQGRKSRRPIARGNANPARVGIGWSMSFAVQKCRLGLVIRTGGMVRARVKIG